MPLATSAERHNHRHESGYEHLATKADVAELRGDIARVESRLESRLEAEIGKLESRLLRWMIAMILTSIIVASSVATVVQGFVN